ncbi:MAG: NTP transferase domain-containing protein [candidate division Zixibacteria bacterium]|nr:NTP transferase domain-containing protein [candidate division Zixibacteria bacterium]
MTDDRRLRGVILAAGFGKRMASLTRHVPKPLLPVANLPAIERILLALHDTGIRETLVVTGYRAEAVEAFCGDGSRWGMSIRYARQTEVTGTASATRLARDFVGDFPFVLTYGDILLEPHEYKNVVRLFFDSDSVAASALNRLEDVSIGSAVFLEGLRITRMIEKPPPGTVATHLNNAGVYVFRPDIFESIDRTPKSARGEYELTEAVQTLLADGATVTGNVIDGVQYDIGTPEAFLTTNEQWIDRDSQHAAMPEPLTDNFASANVIVHAPVAIDPSAQIERCRLGPGVCIGPGVRIGHGAVLEHTVVLSGADIGDGVSLSYAIIGFDTSVPNRFSAEGTSTLVTVLSGDDFGDPR